MPHIRETIKHFNNIENGQEHGDTQRNTILKKHVFNTHHIEQKTDTKQTDCATVFLSTNHEIFKQATKFQFPEKSPLPSRLVKKADFNKYYKTGAKPNIISMDISSSKSIPSILVRTMSCPSNHRTFHMYCRTLWYTCWTSDGLEKLTVLWLQGSKLLQGWFHPRLVITPVCRQRQNK